MRLLITPEPSEEEREAVQAALRNPKNVPALYESGWRRAGLELEESDERYASARRRSSWGAARA